MGIFFSTTEEILAVFLNLKFHILSKKTQEINGPVFLLTNKQLNMDLYAEKENLGPRNIFQFSILLPEHISCFEFPLLDFVFIPRELEV